MKNYKQLNSCQPELSPAEQRVIDGGVKMGGCIPPLTPYDDFLFIPFGPPLRFPTLWK